MRWVGGSSLFLSISIQHHYYLLFLPRLVSYRRYMHDGGLLHVHLAFLHTEQPPTGFSGVFVLVWMGYLWEPHQTPHAMLSVSNHSQNVRSLPARPLFLHTAARYPPHTSPSPLSYPPFSFLSTHPFCQRLIGLEMIRFILAVNAVIMLLYEKKKRKKNYPPRALSLI